MKTVPVRTDDTPLRPPGYSSMQQLVSPIFKQRKTELLCFSFTIPKICKEIKHQINKKRQEEKLKAERKCLFIKTSHDKPEKMHWPKHRIPGVKADEPAKIDGIATEKMDNYNHPPGPSAALRPSHLPMEKV